MVLFNEVVITSKKTLRSRLKNYLVDQGTMDISGNMLDDIVRALCKS